MKGAARLKVSNNKRYLVRMDEQPFFWMGDTAWELFHRLNREDTEVYLTDRACKGFSVIQAVILAELDGLRTPNAYGHLPLEDLDPEKPNTSYFDHVDWVIHTASEKGLYIALLPTWGDKVNKGYDWAEGPEIFTAANAFTYGRWLGRRYKDEEHIVWILGGDRDPDQRAIQIWRSMAAGIIEGVGGKSNVLMSFHPQPFDSGSSSRWFHDDEWLDFNMLQTGHDKDKMTYVQIAEDYALQPPKPVLDGEPTYEAHGLSFQPLKHGYASDVEVRKFAYWSLFAGAFGHTYGCHSIWQFYAPGRKGINSPLYYWKDALQLSGAIQMGYARRLLTSRTSLCRIPDLTLIAVRQPDVGDHVAALRADDGTYAFVYSPQGSSFELLTASLAGDEWQYQWYDPRNGIFTVEQIVPVKEPVLSFQPPSQGYGHDWILVIERIK